MPAGRVELDFAEAVCGMDRLDDRLVALRVGVSERQVRARHAERRAHKRKGRNDGECLGGQNAFDLQVDSLGDGSAAVVG